MATKLAAASMALSDTKKTDPYKGMPQSSVSQKSSSEVASSGAESKIDSTVLPEIEDGKSDENAKLVSTKTGSSKSAIAKDLSLKNKLVAHLNAADAAEKKTNEGSASGVNQSAKRENAAAKVVSDVLSPPADAGADYIAGGGVKGSGGLSLANSETNAEVKRLTDEADRQLTAADDTKAGILEVESVSLFERVSSRINGCLRQRCVNSKSIAKN